MALPLLTSACALYIALLMIIRFNSGDAVFCYVCNSGDAYDGEDCKHIRNESSQHLVKNCNVDFKEDKLNYERCRIMVQEVDKDIRTVRSCATWPEPKKAGRCIDRTGTSKIKIQYCECEGDFCNSGTGLSAAAFAVLFAAFLGIAYFYNG